VFHITSLIIERYYIDIAPVKVTQRRSNGFFNPRIVDIIYGEGGSGIWGNLLPLSKKRKGTRCPLVALIIDFIPLR
jgi:hypothetical protein